MGMGGHVCVRNQRCVEQLALTTNSTKPPSTVFKTEQEQELIKNKMSVSPEVLTSAIN